MSQEVTPPAEPPTPREPLFSEFPAPQAGAWRALAEEQLGGAPFDKKLVNQTPEGIAIQPIYTRDDTAGRDAAGTLPGQDGYRRGTAAGGYHAERWQIAQELPYGTAKEFNEAAHNDLMRGQTALNILLDIATMAGRDPDQAEAGEVGACGVSLCHVRDWITALNGIYVEYLPVHIQAGPTALAVAAPYLAAVKQQGKPLADLRGSFEVDPLGTLARSGSLPGPLDSLYDQMAALTAWAEANAPQLQTVGVSTMPYHGAGASAVEELAAALGTGVAYLRALQKRGLAVDTIAPRMRFSLAIGPKVFVEIAKFRAARQLWAKVVEAFGGNEASRKLHLHARTGLYTKTVNDPYVNMLRTTTEAFSAVVGGVESMHTGPFDEIVRVPDTFSRRIARNTQVILDEECDLWRVVDPAGGSYYIERLTDEIAEGAWKQFQAIEKAGGMLAALADETVQQQIDATAAERQKRFGQRRDVLVGTNMYPLGKEKPLDPRHPDYSALQQQRATELQSYRDSGSPEQDQAALAALQQLTDAEDLKRSEIVDTAMAAATAGATVGEIGRALSRDGKQTEVKPLRFRRLAEPYEQMRAACAAFADANSGHPPKVFLANIGPLRRHKLRADFSRDFFSVAGFEVVYSKGYDDADAAAEAVNLSGAHVVVICGTDDDYPAWVPALCPAIKGLVPDAQLILAGHPGDHEAAYREAGLDDFIFVKTDNYRFLADLLKQQGVLKG